MGHSAPSDFPLIAVVSPGKHKVRVSAPGYFPVTRELNAVDGGVVAADIELKPRPAFLRITTEAGAEISVDGRLIGAAPLPKDIKLAAGTRLITVRKNGHAAVTREVRMKRGERVSMKVSLEQTGQRDA